MTFVRNSLFATMVVVGLNTPVLGQETPAAETVLATVNGTQITLGHVVALAERLPGQYQDVDDVTLFNGILDQLIQQTLLGEVADTSSKRIMLSRENEERALLATTAIEQLVDAELTEEAIQKAYDEQFSNLPAEPEFNASHILVETEEEALAVIEMIEGGADFAETAKEKSTGPSGPNGGSLGWFGKGAMVPEFENTVTSLEVGAVSAPVQTQFGWHVVKLNDARDKPAPTLAEVRNDVSANLRQAIITAKISSLESAAEIVRNTTEIDPALIRNGELLD